MYKQPKQNAKLECFRYKIGRLYSVYMRYGIKYYKYEEVSTWTVWVWVGIEMPCLDVEAL